MYLCFSPPTSTSAAALATSVAPRREVRPLIWRFRLQIHKCLISGVAITISLSVPMEHVIRHVVWVVIVDPSKPVVYIVVIVIDWVLVVTLSSLVLLKIGLCVLYINLLILGDIPSTYRALSLAKFDIVIQTFCMELMTALQDISFFIWVILKTNRATHLIIPLRLVHCSPFLLLDLWKFSSTWVIWSILPTTKAYQDSHNNDYYYEKEQDSIWAFFIIKFFIQSFFY